MSTIHQCTSYFDHILADLAIHLTRRHFLHRDFWQKFIIFCHFCLFSMSAWFHCLEYFFCLSTYFRCQCIGCACDQQIVVTAVLTTLLLLRLHYRAPISTIFLFIILIFASSSYAVFFLLRSSVYVWESACVRVGFMQ